MGNSKSGPKNKLKVTLSIRNFAVLRLPQKPAQFADRVDERMWNEFVSCVSSAATLDTAQERKREYKKWYRNFWIGTAILMIGIFAAIGMGVGGGLLATAILWVFGIILGLFGIVAGLIIFLVSTTKYNQINQQFLSDVKGNVSAKLVHLNNKYANIIRFTVGDTGNNYNIFKSKEDADTTVHIPILIEILSQTAAVQYIPDRQKIVPQTQAQIVMVQMPDGRMVPAQIRQQMAPVQPKTRVVIVPQPQNQAQSIMVNFPKSRRVEYVPAQMPNQAQSVMVKMPNGRLVEYVPAQIEEVRGEKPLGGSRADPLIMNRDGTLCQPIDIDGPSLGNVTQQTTHVQPQTLYKIEDGRTITARQTGTALRYEPAPSVPNPPIPNESYGKGSVQAQTMYITEWKSYTNEKHSIMVDFANDRKVEYVPAQNANQAHSVVIQMHDGRLVEYVPVHIQELRGEKPLGVGSRVHPIIMTFSMEDFVFDSDSD